MARRRGSLSFALKRLLKRWMKIAAVLVVVSGVVVGGAAYLHDGGIDGAVEDLEPVVNGSSELDEKNVAELVHSETNAFRNEQGRPDLRWNDGLSQVAHDHSEYMAEVGKSTHDGAEGGDVNDRLRDYGHPCAGRAGENVAKTYYEVEMTTGDAYYTPEALAKGIVDMFANSEGHREIMLGDHQQIGIGISVAEDEGYTAVYVTQIFC